MGLTTFVFIGIVVFILVLLLHIFKTDGKDVQKLPLPWSLLALGVIVLNWILYLTGFYVRLPQEISEVIFMPIWFVVCILGVIAAIREFRNNLILAILIGGFSAVSLLIGTLLLLIGSM